MQEFLQSYRRTIRSQLENDFEYAISVLPEDSLIDDFLEILAKCDVTRYANHYAEYVIRTSSHGRINISDSENFRDNYYNIRDQILLEIMSNYVTRTRNIHHLDILTSYLYSHRKEQVCK